MIAKEALGVFDIFASFVLLWANQKITSRAGFRDKMAQWALLRRFAYLGATFALFYVGVTQVTGIHPSEELEVAAHSMLLFYAIVFPMLRALGWITQDMLTSDWDRHS